MILSWVPLPETLYREENKTWEERKQRRKAERLHEEHEE
jgi:hypothetical protein